MRRIDLRGRLKAKEPEQASEGAGPEEDLYCPLMHLVPADRRASSYCDDMDAHGGDYIKCRQECQRIVNEFEASREVSRRFTGGR